MSEAAATNLSRHELYELCVQSPTHAVGLLRAIHAQMSHGEAPTPPLVLGEDFAGTCAMSVCWVEQVAEGRAIAVDTDRETLFWRGEHPRIERLVGDVRQATDPSQHAADVLFVGNFSIGELHTRAELIEYLRHAHARLAQAPSGSGVFVCDTYGGESAFLTGEVHRDHWAPGGRRVRYTWEQREADPLTGMVTNALHFRIDKAGMVEQETPDAFIYRWRLWSVPELRDALAEAGFSQTLVYDKVPEATDDEGGVYTQPVERGDDLEESFVVCVAAVV